MAMEVFWVLNYVLYLFLQALLFPLWSTMKQELLLPSWCQLQEGLMSSTSFLIPFVVGSTSTPFHKTMTKGIKSFNKNWSSFDKPPRYDMLRKIKSFNLSQAPKLLWIAKICGNLPLPCCQVVVFNFMSPKKMLFGGKNCIDIICGGKIHEILNEYIWLLCPWYPELCINV